MKILIKSENAIKVIMCIAESDKIISASTISKQTDIKRDHLVEVLNNLKTRKLIKSYKGAWGGYRLNKSIETMTLYDILRATESKINLVKMKSSKYDGVVNQFKVIDEVVNKELDKITLASLMK
ncbi:MAG: Rrf2 family transcriptional regulator [Erysipelotrichaceae bacterium]